MAIKVAGLVENNRGWPIPWIFIEDYHPPDFPRVGQNKQLAFLMPSHSVTLEYRLRCPRRGYHRIGPLLMESGDLFGLQRRFRTGVRQNYISVLPTVAYIDTFNVATKRPQEPVRLSSRGSWNRDMERSKTCRNTMEGVVRHKTQRSAVGRNRNIFPQIHTDLHR